MVLASQRPASSARVAQGQPALKATRAAEPEPLVILYHISQTIAALLNGSASTEKSSLCELATGIGLMTKSCFALPRIASGGAFAGEASAQGVRKCVLHNDRCSAKTDEVGGSAEAALNIQRTSRNNPSTEQSAVEPKSPRDGGAARSRLT